MLEKLLQRKNTRKTGSLYEELALQFLKKAQLRLVCRNFHARHGEIDLVMMDGPVLVFVEVRYRKNKNHGNPLETVGWTKQKKLTQTAMYYLCTKHASNFPACRFDVIGISRDFNQNLTYDWVKNAFELS